MDGVILQQGRFTSTGVAVTLNIRSDVDWMWVYNYTVINAGTADNGAKYYWQRGLNDNDGIITAYNAAGTAVTMATSASVPVNGFTLADTSGNPMGGSVALTGITNGNPPQVNTASTAGLIAGDVVRIFNTVGAQQLGGMDFTINTVVANTSFLLRWMAQIANANPGAGTYRKVNWQSIFYPRNRYISAITQAASAVVTMTVTHGFTVGQEVRFKVPSEYGMTQIDGLTGTITAISAANNTITVDINSTAFTAFAFPLSAVGAAGFTQAQVVPVGEAADGAYANLLDDATENVSLIGMTLAAGTRSPAGSNGNVIYWVAGKSFSVDNQ